LGGKKCVSISGVGCSLADSKVKPPRSRSLKTNQWIACTVLKQMQIVGIFGLRATVDVPGDERDASAIPFC
jgi:hypothetical protein